MLDELDEIIADRVVQLAQPRRPCSSSELADRLPDWELPMVRGGLSLWARLPHGSAAAFARFAARFGVAVAGGREFTASQTVDDHIRLPFTASEQHLHDGSQASVPGVGGVRDRAARRPPQRAVV